MVQSVHLRSWSILVAAAFAAAVGCGDGNADEDSAGCERGETRACVGEAACEGGQICEGDGWGACECGASDGSGGTGSGGDAATGGKTNSGGSPSGGGAGECLQLSLGQKIAVQNDSSTAIFLGDHALIGDGESLEGKRLSVETYWPGSSITLGTFDLAEEGGYEDCLRCITVGRASDETYFYAVEGSLTVSAYSEASGAELSFSGVRLIEVAATDGPWTSVPVEDGRCIELSDGEVNTTPAAVPVAWSCPSLSYSDATCDCGCEVLDPFCLSKQGECDGDICASSELPDPEDNTQCIVPPPAPASWTCTDLEYADQYCDCGCGLVDPACGGGGVDACTDDHCAASEVVDPSDIAACIDIPEGWLCNDSDYKDGGCDCGCGVADPACENAQIASCDFHNCRANHGPGGRADPADTTQCSGWYCSAAQYTDQVCECGCGIADPACESSASSACEFNSCAGLHSAGSAKVDADENWKCEGVPEAWTCRGFDYLDTTCDCGCGVIDAACESNAAATACDFNFCSGTAASGSAGVDTDENWKCIP